MKSNNNAKQRIPLNRTKIIIATITLGVSVWALLTAIYNDYYAATIRFYKDSYKVPVNKTERSGFSNKAD